MEINKIYNENCLETMSRMPDGFIDLTVTSPPYSNLRDYKKNYSWDYEIFKSITNELFRVTNDGGVVVWVVGDATINGSETGDSFRQALYFKEIGFNLHDTMIYDKGSCPFPDSTRYYNVFEYMFVFSKGKIKTFNPIQDRENKNANEKIQHTTLRQKDGNLIKTAAERNNTGRKIKEFGYRFNIWRISPGWKKSHTDDIAYSHPATYPEQLANDHIISWSKEQDIIYDPFTGSGTTLKMAKKNNRNFIGSEIAKEYCEIAEKRLELV